MLRIIYLLFLFSTSIIFYSSGQSQTRSIATAANVAPAGINWATRNNSFISDNAYAVAQAGISRTLQGTNLGFTIPATAIIDAIRVRVERNGRAIDGVAVVPAFTQVRTAPLTALNAINSYTPTTYTLVIAPPVVTNANRMMLVTVGIENVDNNMYPGDTGSDPSISNLAVTYGGIPMTLLNIASSASGTTRNMVAVFYMLDATIATVANATTTGNTISISKTRTAIRDDDEYVEMVSIVQLKNVNQAFPVQSSAVSGSGTSISSAALGVAIGDMVFAATTSNDPAPNFNSPVASFAQINGSAYSNNGGATTGAALQVSQRSITVTGVGTVTPTATATVSSGRLNQVGFVVRSARVFDESVRLVKGGTIVGTNLGNGAATLAAAWPEVDATFEYFDVGNPLWGTTWTPAQINAANFGMAIQADARNAIASIDYIEIQVDYTILLSENSAVQFDAKYISPTVQTLTKINNNEYEMLTLERSINGEEFEKVEDYPISNLSLNQKKSIYTDDKNPHFGTSYYRIKLANQQKEITYISEVKKVDSSPVETETLIYPNPAKDIFYVSSLYNKENNPIQTIEMVTLSGQIISLDYTILPNQTISVNLPSSLSKGIYVIRCTSLTESYFSKLCVF